MTPSIIRYHRQGLLLMSDVVIKDVPDDIIAALDALANRLGLSRNEYLRRRLAQDARAAKTPSGRGDTAPINRAWEGG